MRNPTLTRTEMFAGKLPYVGQQQHEANMTDPHGEAGHPSPETDDTTTNLDAIRDDYHDLRDHIERGFTDLERGFSEMRHRLHTSINGQQRLIESFIGDEG